jgi:S-adenosylmethionine:tRNA ribosyltransferase-isomerase
VLVDSFDYDLPVELVAQQPLPRGQARMMCLPRAEGPIRHSVFSEFAGRLRPGDLLVRNDARVIPARIFGQDDAGRPVEILLTERPGPDEAWVLARPARRARPGARIRLPEGIEARVIESGDAGRRRVRFFPPLDDARLSRVGRVPLPPYIRRSDEPADKESYQTIFARVDGAVAAPTAGLHFTREILDEIRSRGIGIADLTLLVGPGTFRPVTAERVADHKLDEEAVAVPAETGRRILQVRREGGRVVAVGTTVTRALETWIRRPAERFRTGLFIVPGFEFRVVDALLTNFHLPRSTLLMLVAAFAGRERVLDAYRAAVAERYRFYSYGDCMFIE